MSAADYAALASGIIGIIGAVTALIKVLQHSHDASAHNGKSTNGPQSLRLRHGGIS